MPIPVISLLKPVNTPVGTGGVNPTIEDVDILGGMSVLPTHAARNGIPTTNQKVGMLVYTQNDGLFWTLNSIGSSNGNWSPANFAGEVVLAGDVSGVATGTVVGSLQGNPIATGALATGVALTWNGSQWAGQPITAAGDVSGNVSNTVVGKLQGNPIATGAIGTGTVLTWNGFQWTGTANNNFVSPTITGRTTFLPTGPAPAIYGGVLSQVYTAQIIGTTGTVLTIPLPGTAGAPIATGVLEVDAETTMNAPNTTDAARFKHSWQWKKSPAGGAVAMGSLSVPIAVGTNGGNAPSGWNTNLQLDSGSNNAQIVSSVGSGTVDIKTIVQWGYSS